MTSELEQLVRSTVKNRCETQTLEVKAAAQDAPKVYDSLSSFSNQNEGGIIVFGIDEQAGFRFAECTTPRICRRKSIDSARA